MKASKTQRIEITLLLEAVFQRYGYDFRGYSRGSIERRVRQFLGKSGCGTISKMIPKLLHDEGFFEQFLPELSITVTEMFRDPPMYRSMRKKVVPLLKTYPFIKVWHAGCATGEEAYSLAILLTEEGLYDRSTIFATDFNDASLEKARNGIYDLGHIKAFTFNYQQALGTRPFSEYYHARYGSIAVKQSLNKNIIFANHNLVTDTVFGEMHLILCRNVLIYFDQALQNRVLKLFSDSLAHGGFLCLGSKENPQFSDVENNFKAIDPQWRIYQKRERGDPN